MDIRLMEYFLAVVREGNISAAAAALHVSQPALSRQMKDLEEELGVELFLRGHRSITLTEEGSVLRRRAEEMVSLLQITEREINQVRNHLSGEVRIGTGESLAFHHLSKIAGRIHRDHPDVRFSITSGDTADLMEQLDNGLLDVALMFSDYDNSRYSGVQLPEEDKFAMLMRKDSPLAEKDVIKLSDLQGIPLIVPRAGRELFENSDVISEGGGFPIVSGHKVFFLCESGQKGCGTVEFTVKARLAKGPFFGSGDGMARAMGLVRDIGASELSGTVLETVRNFEAKMAGAELSPVMANILTAMKHNTLTPTVVSGKNVNEVTVTCDVRLLPGFDREYLTTILDDLSRKWDCEYRILSLSTGYESSPEADFLRILDNATKKVWGPEGDIQILPFVSMGSSDGRFLVDSHARVYGYSPVYPWDMTFDTAVTMVHGVNERIHKKSVVFGTDVLTEAIKEAVREEK